MNDVEFTSRYDVPHVTGPGACPVCEGFGCYPVKRGDWDTDDEAEAWDAAEDADPTDDGWHHIRCPACGGSGLRR